MRSHGQELLLILLMLYGEETLQFKFLLSGLASDDQLGAFSQRRDDAQRWLILRIQSLAAIVDIVGYAPDLDDDFLNLLHNGSTRGIGVQVFGLFAGYADAYNHLRFL